MIRDALREHLRRLSVLERERHDREGYERHPGSPDELGVWEKVAAWPDDGMKQPCAVNLHNVVTVARDALGSRLTQSDVKRMREVCSALAFAVGCDT